MEEALIQIGLPVKCAFGDCGNKSFVKPQSDYGGWYKSKFFRFRLNKRWYCPEHYQEGREIDNRFYRNYATPDPYTKTEIESFKETQEELYKLLED